MKHTKGPWYSTYRADDGFFVRADARSLAICKVVHNAENIVGEDEANQALISAAPEMLEALIELSEAIEGSPEYSDAMKSHGFHIDVVDSLRSVKKLIHKAKGGTQ